MAGVRRLITTLALALFATGCVTIHQPAGGDFSLDEAPQGPKTTATDVPGTLRSLPPPPNGPQDGSSIERLGRLRDERLRSGAGTDTPIGPGDVIEVAAPGVKELAFVSTRVSGDGIIVLPILGTIRAAGRTENEIRQDVRTKLGSIMYNPQVSVFVREYHSRKVAVLGAVMKAGLYELASPNETIFDLITMARGPSTDAARQVIFVPRGAATTGELEALAALPKEQLAAATAPSGLRNVEPIVFDFRDMSVPMTEVVLSLPVRPGDVIMIPEA